MFHNSLTIASKQDETIESLADLPQSIMIYNALVTALNYPGLIRDDIAGDEIIAMELEYITREIAAEIGDDKAAEVLQEIISADTLDENTASTEQQMALNFLRNHFNELLLTEALESDDVSDEEEAMYAISTSASTHSIKRKIRSTHDAAAALYQLIDEKFSADFDAAGLFARAATALSKTEKQSHCFISEGVSDSQIENDKHLDRYNRLTRIILNAKPLANTEPNAHFIKSAFIQIRKNILLHFKSKSEAEQLNAEPISDQSQLAEPSTAIRHYNAIQRRFSHTPLEDNEIKAAHELKILVNIIHDAIVDINMLLGHEDDAKSAEDKTAGILSTFASTTDIDENNASTETTLALEAIREYFLQKPAAVHHDSAKLDPQWSETEITTVIDLMIDQPEQMFEKVHDSYVQNIQITPHITLERSVLRILSENIKQIKTPIEKYNLLIATLFQTAESTPLADTASNSAYAEKTLQASIESTKTALQNATPAISPTDIDDFITHVYNKEKTPSIATYLTVQKSLQQQLRASLHEPLRRYNALQCRNAGSEQSLENTVENNVTAAIALEQLHRAITEKIGDETKAQDILSKIATSSSSYFYGEAELSPQEEIAAALLLEHFKMANLIGWYAEDQPSIYTRVILALMDDNTLVTPADKIALLTDISRMITERQSNLVKLKANNQSQVVASEKQKHVNVMAAYFEKSTSGLMTTLGIHTIKYLYALKFGEEAPALTQEAPALSFSPEEHTIATLSATNVTETTIATTEAIAVNSTQQGNQYQRQSKPAANPSSTSAANLLEKRNAEEARQTVLTPPKKEKANKFTLAQLLADAAAEARKDEIQKQAPAQWIKERLIQRLDNIRKRTLIKTELAAQENEERKAKAAALAMAEQQAIELQQRELAKERAALKKERKATLIANMLAHAKTVRENQQNPMLNFIQQLRMGDAMPAGYLSRTEEGEKLSDLLSDIVTDPIRVVTTISTPASQGAQPSVTGQDNAQRVYVTPPHIAIMDNANAMRERMHEYAMQFVMPYYAKNKAIDEVIDKMIAAFLAKVSLLIELIQRSCSVADKSVMTEHNVTLAKMFTLPKESNYILHFENLYKVQAAVIKHAKAYAKADDQIARLIKELSVGSNEIVVMRDIATSNACKTMALGGKPTESVLATQLQEKTASFAKLTQSNEGKFLRRVRRIWALNDSIKQPMPLEKAAQQFLLQLPVLYAAKEEAEMILSDARSNFATASDKTAADIAIRSAEISANIAENEMIDAFKSYCRKISRITNANQNIARVRTEAEISNDVQEFTQRFLSHIDSRRLQRMKLTAMTALENLEIFHMTAYGNAHPNKALFNEYRRKIWGISVALSTATENETDLKAFLAEFIRDKAIGHETVLKIDPHGLIDIEPSAAEDQRMRLLTSEAYYLQSLERQKETSGHQIAADIITMKTVIQQNMQAVLALDMTGNGCKEMLDRLRSSYEASAAQLAQRIASIIAASKEPVASQTAVNTASSSSSSTLRAPGNFGLQEEARRKQAYRHLSMPEQQKAQSPLNRL